MIKNLIKSMVRSLGYDIKGYHPARSEDAQMMAMLASHKIDLVFDVGANVGQFAKRLRQAGYKGRIVSFEPLTVAREQLFSASRNDAQWEIAPQAAVGSEDGNIEINIAANSVSSSVLGMLDIHSKAAPNSAYVTSEKIPLRRLDTLASDYLNSHSKLFLKIDTQGYEAHVLKGAHEVLGNAVGLQLELSLVPLYEGQILYDELASQVKDHGFELWGLSPAFIDPADGRLLQVDATFFRT